MLSNKDIACGLTRQNRYQVAAFWKSLETALNTAGPPTKSVFEWKKVWTDQKRYVRKKATQNLQHSRGTGGGPNRTVPLSASENAIYDLIGAKDAVEGIPQSNVFGINQTQSSENLQSFDIPNEILGPCNIPPVASSENISSVASSENLMGDTSSCPSPLSSPKLKRKRMTTAMAVEVELNHQKELCKSAADAVREMKEGNKENSANFKRIYRALEKGNLLLKEGIDLKREEFEEKKRHNKRMEELKKNKIEKKLEIAQKLLQLKQYKMNKEEK